MQPVTVSSTAINPYGIVRVTIVPRIPVSGGVNAIIHGDLAQRPRGCSITSQESAPSSGNIT